MAHKGISVKKNGLVSVRHNYNDIFFCVWDKFVNLVGFAVNFEWV